MNKNAKFVSLLFSALVTTSVSLIFPIKAVIGLPLPHINQHQSYRELRTKLINMGWQPVNFSSSERNERANVISQRENWQELEICSTTGKGVCRFVFQDEFGNELVIVTHSNEPSIPIERRYLIDNWMYEPVEE